MTIVIYLLSKDGGQCSPTSNNAGYWYSFNSASECDQNDSIGGHNCTWKGFFDCLPYSALS